MSTLRRCPACDKPHASIIEARRHLARHDIAAATPTARGHSARLADALLTRVLDGFAQQEQQT